MLVLPPVMFDLTFILCPSFSPEVHAIIQSEFAGRKKEPIVLDPIDLTINVALTPKYNGRKVLLSEAMAAFEWFSENIKEKCVVQHVPRPPVCALNELCSKRGYQMRFHTTERQLVLLYQNFILCVWSTCLPVCPVLPA